MNKLRSVLVKAVGLGLLFVASASMAQVVVSPGDAQGWFEKSGTTGTFGLGIADNNGGTSSLLMSTDGSAGQIINAARIPLIRINAITSLSWDVYSDNAGNYPRPQLEFYSFSAGGGTLVYDASNLSLAPNTWTSVTINLGSDLFWNTDIGSSDKRTLAAWQAVPGVGDSLMNFFRMGYGSSSGVFAATTAYMDYVELNGTTWDFEDVAVLPPEPAPPAQKVPTMSEWAMITLAMLLAGIVFIRRKQLS